MKNTKTVYHTFDFSKTLYYDYIERDLFLNSLKFIQKSKKSLKKKFHYNNDIFGEKYHKFT